MVNQLGNEGESKAIDFLSKKGYKILAKNWRSRHCEIDIIAYYQNTLIIVEVKTRETDLYGHPAQFVNYKKHQNLFRATEDYVEQKNYHGEIRFDIISIFNKGKENWVIEHFEDAFYPS